MAITKVRQVAIPSQSLSAGTNRGTGINSGSIDITGKYGGDFLWQVNNGATGPTTPVSITVQASADNSTWYDYATVAGDTVGTSYNAGTLWIDQGIMYVRVLAYGNVGSAVTVQAEFSLISGI